MEKHKLIICLFIFTFVGTAYCEPRILRRQEHAPTDASVEDNELEPTQTKEENDQHTTPLSLTDGDDDQHTAPEKLADGENDVATEASEAADKNCWLEVDAQKHFDTMDRLDEIHQDERKSFQKATRSMNLDNHMLEKMLESRGAAERAIYNFGGDQNRIPAGFNLGSYGMMKLNDAILFFHRMKLRNDTQFRVNYLNNDVFLMVMTARLSLNDLRLFGQYERAITDKDSLFYRPTFGELEILLKAVTYKIEGRLRLVQDRLVVEHVLSELHMKDVLLMYYVNGSTNCQSSEQLPPSAISEFLERLKADLDSWVKDYFNDYLLRFKLSGHKKLEMYDKTKQMYLNEFMDKTIKQMQKKLYSLKPSCASVKTPAFSIFSINGVQIRLHSGVIRGMDSFYRRSVATGRSDNKLRLVDAVIGFSKLKMEYKYLAKITGKTPPVMGLFVLSADDLIAHLGVTMVKDPEAVELSVGYLRQTRPQTLVIEGAINRMVGNYKHVLENEIISLMTNSLSFQVKQLASLSRCEPTLVCHEDDGDVPYRGESPHHGHGPDFGMKRNDSIEIEVPGDGDKRPPKKMHIRYHEDLAIDESELAEDPTHENGDIVEEKENTDNKKQHTEETKSRKSLRRSLRRTRKSGKRGGALKTIRQAQRRAG
ncbi:hypothetical protein O0L34_g6169 [Tuta absoluta]|nr:hypothetical protein O0L34_g6169 [Tuta absoluta]